MRAEEKKLADALRLVSKRHPLDSEVHELTPLFAGWSDFYAHQLTLRIEQAKNDPARDAQAAPLPPAAFHGNGSRGTDLLSDLQELVLIAAHVQSLWIVVALAAQARSDGQLDALAEAACAQTERQLAWCRTQIKLLAPQVLKTPLPQGKGGRPAAARANRLLKR